MNTNQHITNSIHQPIPVNGFVAANFYGGNDMVWANEQKYPTGTS